MNLRRFAARYRDRFGREHRPCEAFKDGSTFAVGHTINPAGAKMALKGRDDHFKGNIDDGW
jgi:hypothetical protein